jgi:hypothetical protein
MTEMSPTDFADDTVLGWLQEPSYPSMRYYTLRHLLDRPAGDSEVIAARKPY